MEITQLDENLATASDVEEESEDSEEEETAEQSETSFCYDITLYDEDGETLDNSWSRDGLVTVSFSGEKIEELKAVSEKAEIFYVGPKGKEKKVKTISFKKERKNLTGDAEDEETDSEAAEISFDAEHFSVYRLAFEGSRSKREISDYNDFVDVFDEIRDNLDWGDPAGSYTLTLTQDIEVPDNSRKLSFVDGDITIKGNGHQIIYQDGVTDKGVLTVRGYGSLTLDGPLTITSETGEGEYPLIFVGGLNEAESTGSDKVGGGGSLTINSKVELVNHKNTAEYPGGAIAVQGGQVYMWGDSLIENCTSEYGLGGAVGLICDQSLFEMMAGTIRGCEAQANEFLFGAIKEYASFGGAVYSHSSTSVDISGNAVIEENKAASGGGIAACGSKRFTMSGGQIRNNEASVTGPSKKKMVHCGGGLYLNGADASGPDLSSMEFRVEVDSWIEEDDNIIMRGKKGRALGAGFHITGGVISGNKAGAREKYSSEENGGGICVSGSKDKPIALEISNVEISDNMVTGSNNPSGGGLYMANYCDNTPIKECTITGNSAGQYGMGVYIDYSSNVSLTDCTISENGWRDSDTLKPGYVGEDGGLFIRDCSDFEVSGCEVQDNWAKYGGGVLLDKQSASSKMAVILDSNDITDNHASLEGGGLCINGAEVKENTSIIANNIAGEGGQGSDICSRLDSSSFILPDAKDMKQIYKADGKDQMIDGWYVDTADSRYTPNPDGVQLPVDGTFTGEQALVASYKAERTYTVTFNPGDHGVLNDLGPNESVSGTYKEGAFFPKRPSTHPEEGYLFDGWYDEQGQKVEDGDFPSKVTENAEYTARWKAKEYTVTFKPGEHGTLKGAGVDGQVTGKYKHGDKFPERPGTAAEEGYLFDGWMDEADQNTVEIFPQIITKDAVYIARWKAEEKPDPVKKTGDLKVSVTVSGSGASREKAFGFTVTLEGSDADSVNGRYGDMEFQKGTASFSLKHGQSKKAEGLPSGVSYTVTEDGYTGYTVSSLGAQGSIPEDSMATAVFDNYKSGGSSSGGGGSSHSGGKNPIGPAVQEEPKLPPAENQQSAASPHPEINYLPVMGLYGPSLEGQAAGQPAAQQQDGRQVIDLLAAQHSQNPDLAGWLTVPGTGNGYPVMYTPGNWEYYLHHNFQKQQDRAGIPFLGEGCVIGGDNTLIHGHNMNGALQFGYFWNYTSPDFCSLNRTIDFKTIYDGDGAYEVMAVFFAPVYPAEAEGVFMWYQYVGALNPAQFDYYVEQAKAASLYDTGVTAEYGDKLITLETCADNHSSNRLVVVARKKAQPQTH